MKSQRLTELLTEAVGIPSVNPAHSADPEKAGEARFAEWLARQLSARGFQVDLPPLLGEGRPAVLAQTGPDSGRRLMFGVHLDTVGVDQMTVDPFRATLNQGRIYGRGTCDMKGSTAALLHALTPERVQALCARGVRLYVIGTPDEECGMGGATALAQTDLRFDDAVILEPTRCRPVVAHKSAHWVELALKGRGGHGSQPSKGINTNHALATLLPGIFAIQKKLEKTHVHPLLGHSTLSIGQILGGSAFNMIADQTVVRLDRRIVPGEPPEAFDGAVSALLEKLCASGDLLEGSLKVAAHTPPFSTDPDCNLVVALQQSISDITGEKPEPEGTSWVSDAAPFSTISQSTVVFGPGDIAQAHTADEFIEQSQLETGSRILGHLLDRYPQS